MGRTAATGVTVVSATNITATTQAHAAAVVDVVVTNPDGQTGDLTGGFTYLITPVVTSISPNSGPTAGGTAVTITGDNYESGATVTFGGTSPTGVTVVSATNITATTPTRAKGAVDVVVTNPDTQFGTLSSGFTYLAPPTVTSMAPISGPTAGGTGVTLTGDDFQTGATVTLGGSAATGVTVVSATNITATTPAHAEGVVAVRVTNPDSQTGDLAGAFTYVAPPTVTSIAPSSGPTAGGTAVTITGDKFQTGAIVALGGATATGVTVVSATNITATTPAHAEGAVDVVVTNPDSQTGDLTGGYTYVAPPTVTSIAPTSGPIGGGTAVTITGDKFQTGATVTLGGSAATGVTVVSATNITATTPAHGTGAVDVVITNPDSQTGDLTGGFTYQGPPSVTSISPTSGPTAGGTPVTITGDDFQSGATVTLGGTAATGVTVVSATNITATTPLHGEGAVDVVVTNPDTQNGSLSGG